MTLFTLCRFLLLATLSMQVYSSCYFPDGTYVAHDRPCIDNGTQESFCCGPGFSCLSDKVCYLASTSQYTRGSCTDETFRSPSCPQFCFTPNNHAQRMYQCGARTDSYCCSPDRSPCSCQFGNVTLGASSSDVSLIASISSEVPTNAYGSQVLPSSATSIIPMSSSRTTTSAEITTLPPASSELPHITVVSSATTTTSISAHPSGTVNFSDASSSSHGSYKEVAAIGVPVAILSVAIILLVALLIRNRSRTQSKMANLSNQLANNSSSVKNPVEQQRWELTAGVAATELEGPTEIPELVA